MRMVSYPAIMHKEGKHYWISFPDFNTVFSQGDNCNDAISKSIEALTLELDFMDRNGEKFPEASKVESLSLNASESVAFVAFDFDEQRKGISYNKSIKKTLSIPEWLNDAAMNAGINFSATLQDALKAKLGIR